MKVIATVEFRFWYKQASLREKAQVSARLSRIENANHFGDGKYIAEGVAELRWKNGRRIYFAKVEGQVLLLTGGYKNDQKKDIKKAKRILRKYAKLKMDWY